MDAADEKNQVQRNVDYASKTDMGLTQFHPTHSYFIQLQKDSTVALCQSFSYKHVFSKQLLVAGEIFLLDVKAVSAGTKDSFQPFHIAFRLKPTTPNARARLYDGEYLLVWVQQDAEDVHNDFIGEGDYVKTARGLIPKSLLLPTVVIGVDEVYVRLGIFFVPEKDNPKKVQLRVVVNGQNLYIKKHSIPFDDLPLYLMIMFCDAFELRIVQYQGVSSLHNACRNVIRESYTVDEIRGMPIPMLIKRFLISRDW